MRRVFKALGVETVDLGFTGKWHYCKTKAMHTALEMKGSSTKTICTACYHLTIVVFCTIKE